MKIALSTSAIQGGRSGVGQYVLSLARALLPAARRHGFTLYVLERDLPLFSFAVGKMWLEPVSERYRAPVRNILWHQTVLPELLRQGGFDLLHVPTYRRMLWQRPCALVATIHDLAPFHVARKYDFARSFYGRVVARRLARRQDELLAVSRLTAEDLQRHFRIDERRITVVHNGLDHTRFRPGPAAEARDEVCEPMGIDRPFFLYVSRLEHPAKNHLRLIDAFERFKLRTGSPWLLVLAGADWHGASEIHARIRCSSFRREIRILGFLEDRLVPVWYRAADALIYPSLYEGFGLPVVEAMACGCPVLASMRGALGEVAAGAAATLDPENPEAMSAAIERIAGDAPERARLREAGLARAAQFDWGKNAEATLRVYERAVGARRGWVDRAVTRKEAAGAPLRAAQDAAGEAA